MLMPKKLQCWCLQGLEPAVDAVAALPYCNDMLPHFAGIRVSVSACVYLFVHLCSGGGVNAIIREKSCRIHVKSTRSMLI